jgi:hypothetical protein
MSEPGTQPPHDRPSNHRRRCGSSDLHQRHVVRTPRGGQLISCSFNDQLGTFAPGETRSASLGTLGALVVPLENGEPTEDWTDLGGAHVERVEITTAGSTGAWGRLRFFPGF